jgi:hypothetical protein
MERKMRTLKISLLVFILSINTSAQAPDTLWTKTYGGAGSEVGYSVDQTNDGAYIIAGFTDSFGFGNNDVWLIKTDECGDTVWTKIYGGELNDVAFTVHQTFESGYVLSGHTDSFGNGNGDFWLIKTDENGDTLWSKTYGGTAREWCRYSEQTSDSGFILIGIIDSLSFNSWDIWLIKTDKNGNNVWTKTYGGDMLETGFGIEQTSDGGYILVGFTNSFGAGDNDVWLIRTNENGDSIWTRTFGGSNSDAGYSVKQTKDGGFIIAGSTESIGSGGSDMWILKTNENGDTLWTKVIGGIENEWPTSIQQAIGGGYIISAYTKSYGEGDCDAWLIKTDENGNILWDETFGGEDFDGAFSVHQAIDGCYIIVGSTQSFGPDDLWLLKIESDSIVNIEDKDLSPSEFILRQNYPNPFNPSTVISYRLPVIGFVTLKVYDILGRVVATLVNEEKPAGEYEVEFNRANLPSGIYFYQLKAGEFTETKKMILLK